MNTPNQPNGEATKPSNGMFKNPFGFNGRIGRTEYVLSLIIIVIATYIGNNSHSQTFNVFIRLVIIYFLTAQGAKRCHDIDKSGWWLVASPYFIYILFVDGTPGENEYGKNPIGKVLEKDTNVQLNQDSVKVYSAPDISSEVIATLNKKDSFLLCPNNNNSSTDWDLIKLSNQQSGYIDAKTKVAIA